MDPDILLVFAILISVLVCLSCIRQFLISIRARKIKQQGFSYVYINDDGSARELDLEEIKYLSTEFLGGDGARPYVKSNYETLTPDGKMHGYLWRQRLPKTISIEPAPDDQENRHPKVLENPSRN